MLKIVFCSVLLGLVCSTSVADEFNLLKAERIGELRIGLPERDVKKIIRCPLQQGAEQLWEADGAYHQQWNFVSCGISLGMISTKKKAQKSISSISIKRPSTLKTLRGIGIGSAEQDVIKSYQSDWNTDESIASKSFVAGSIYGGLIFELQNGKVSSIFLGAAAE